MSSNGHPPLAGNIRAPLKSDVEPLPQRPLDDASPGPHSRAGMPPSTNVLKIAKIEGEQLRRRSLAERAGDRLVTLAGSGASAVFHLCWFAAWALVNLDLVPGVPAFDPYPFSFLTMTVSLEAVFITIAVLNRQNRMARQADGARTWISRSTCSPSRNRPPRFDCSSASASTWASRRATRPGGARGRNGR